MNDIRRELRELMDSVYQGEIKALVFGEGDPHARLMLIGEAPGEQEAVQGRPFVGRAGKNLDMFIEATGLRREEMYITNVVKFRPSRTSRTGRTVNRTPSREEIALCRPFLMREIAAVNPDMIVTLGNVPLSAVVGPENTIGQVHGQIIERAGMKVFPMYHPAAIIYNRSLREVFAADMAKLARITEKLQENNE
jgi:uracil-DNA glycosylase family 4